MDDDKVYELLLNMSSELSTTRQRVDEMYSKMDNIDQRLQKIELNYGQRISRVEQTHADLNKMSNSRMELWMLLFTLANLLLMLWGR